MVAKGEHRPTTGRWAFSDLRTRASLDGANLADPKRADHLLRDFSGPAPCRDRSNIVRSDTVCGRCGAAIIGPTRVGQFDQAALNGEACRERAP